MSLRYDASVTLLDLSDAFRSTHVIEPSLSLRTRRWGITQGFYQLQRFDYYYDLDDAFDLDGWQHSAGVNQIMVLPEPFTHARGGFTWTTRDSKGSEFSFSSFGINVGTGVLLPWYDVEASALYRFSHLPFANASQFPKNGDIQDSPPTGTKRRENLHEITFNLNLPLWKRLSLDVAGALIFNESNVETFQYDRQIVGAYFTWDFGSRPKFGGKARGGTDAGETVEEEGRFPGE